jgi:hypothetical protein
VSQRGLKGIIKFAVKYNRHQMGFLMFKLLFIKRVSYELKIIIANILLISNVNEFLGVLKLWGCL